MESLKAEISDIQAKKKIYLASRSQRSISWKPA